MCDNAQLLVYVRFFNKQKKEFCEDLLGVTRGAVSLAPPKPGADTAALQRGAALGRHRDPAVPVAPQTRAAAAQVHQDRSPVRDCVCVCV